MTDCDTAIAESGVATRHAKLRWRGDDLVVEPIGPAPITVNGTAVTQPTVVSDGDWLALGTALHQVALAAPEPADVAPPVAPTVSVAEARVRGRASVTVGRSADCDIRINSPIVSRHHARLVRDADASVLAHRVGGATRVSRDGTPLLEVELPDSAVLVTADGPGAKFIVGRTSQSPGKVQAVTSSGALSGDPQPYDIEWRLRAGGAVNVTQSAVRPDGAVLLAGVDAQGVFLVEVMAP